MRALVPSLCQACSGTTHLGDIPQLSVRALPSPSAVCDFDFLTLWQVDAFASSQASHRKFCSTCRISCASSNRELLKFSGFHPLSSNLFITRNVSRRSSVHPFLLRRTEHLSFCCGAVPLAELYSTPCARSFSASRGLPDLILRRIRQVFENI